LSEVIRRSSDGHQTVIRRSSDSHEIAMVNENMQYLKG
jgi:hypothetical protein